jgi:uncharacterized protein
MRRLISVTIASAALAFALSYGSTAAAAADPTMAQVYQAAESGHLDQAQQMMNQVLADHPQSGTAHYVQAELYAKEGKPALARSELQAAETLEPGLPHIAPQSVQNLKAELGLEAQGAGHFAGRVAPPARPFPWGMALIFAAVIGILWMVLRRRNTYASYPAGYPAGGAPGAYGPGGGYGPGPLGGGMGSGIAGGLASGLAVGAGVVAGEELAHHFMDGNRSGGVLPPAEGSPPIDNPNADMGGANFGVDDPSSWDDGSSGGGGDFGGGGGDWT